LRPPSDGNASSCSAKKRSPHGARASAGNEGTVGHNDEGFRHNHRAALWFTPVFAHNADDDRD
jgi:hypothetical protein